MLKVLEEKGELENTLVVMSGDNGLPFPRCKSNLYDSGTNVPLAVRWPGANQGRAGRRGFRQPARPRADVPGSRRPETARRK